MFGKIYTYLTKNRDEFRINSNTTFEYKGYPLVYAIAPLQNNDLPREKDRGANKDDLFNMLICSKNPKAKDNMCFYFSRFGMFQAEELGLERFMA